MASSCQLCICINEGDAPAMNGVCEAAATFAISPSNSTSGGRLIEVVVADDATERFAAQGAVFLLVDLLEDRALIPRRSLEALEVLVQLLLGDVEHLDLQKLVRLGIVDEVV